MPDQENVGTAAVVVEPEQEPRGAEPTRAVSLREDLAAIVAAHDRFVELKRTLIEKVGGVDDIGGKPYVNKAGWLCTGNFFKVSIEGRGIPIVNVLPAVGDERATSVQLCVPMRARLGDRYFDAVGSVDTSEDFARRGNFAPENAEGAAHLVRRKWSKAERRHVFEWSWHYPKPWSALVAFAQTRAINRAIGGLLGLAEVSAEEIIGSEDTGDDLDERDKAKAGVATSGAPATAKPVEGSAAQAPENPVNDVFRLREKLVELVGSESTGKIFGGALKDAGIGRDVVLYPKKDKPNAVVATPQQVLQLWRILCREVDRVEAAQERRSEAGGIGPDEKGVS